MELLFEHFSWLKRIELARERRRFTASDVAEAHMWNTSPCGLLGNKIRKAAGVPEDEILFVLEHEFTKAVNSNDFDRAEELVYAIDRRAIALMGSTVTAKSL